MNLVPQTLAAFLSFLGLVTPGLVFQLLRERRRASRSETAFREASRVALTSFAFTSMSLAILAAVRGLWSSAAPDVGRWLREGTHYFTAEYSLVLRTLLVEVAIACLLAVFADWLLKGSAHGQIVGSSIWFLLLRTERPEGQVPWLHLHLKDATDFFGNLAWYTPEQKQEDREIALKGPGLIEGVNGEEIAIDDWSSVIVCGDAISYIKVSYVPEEAPDMEEPEHQAGSKPH